MDKIDSLIKTLTEFKEELEKASKDPALAPKEVKIKELQGKIDAGTYKPDASKIADKMLKKGPNEASVAAPAANGTPDMAKEELTCSANGQWNLIKAVPGISSKHIFSMDHIKNISETKDHGSAKKMAHSAIESSNAREENKNKAKQMVDQSKSVNHLAQGMTNFHMAHDAKIRGRLGGKKDNE
jgi:anti-sigma28 factor (negative regulator of flagellin synthesis)